MKPEAHTALVLARVAVTAVTAFSGGILRSSRALSPNSRFRNNRLVAWEKVML
jgi:hypothetical protein